MNENVNVEIPLYQELRRIEGDVSDNTKRLSVHEAECGRRYGELRRDIHDLSKWFRVVAVILFVIGLNQFFHIDGASLIRLISIAIP